MQRQDSQADGPTTAEALPAQHAPAVLALRAQALAATDAARRARGELLDQPRHPGPARLR